MSKEIIFFMVAATIYGAVLYMLVRPGSNGPQLVNNIFNALSDLVRGSVGYSYDASTGKWASPT
jgi:hypothetical protein